MVTARPGIRYQALVLLAALLMVIALLGSLSGFWRLDTSQNTLLLMAAFSVAYSWAWWRSTWLGLALTFLIALVAIVGVRNIAPWALYIQALDSQGAEFLRALMAGRFDTTFGPIVGDLLLLLSAVGVGLVTCHEALSRGKAFWSIALGGLIFGTQWAWFYDPSELYFVVYIVLAFWLWVLGQAARRDATWLSAGRKVGSRSQIGAPIAAVLMVALVAGIMPKEFAPLNMGALGNRLQQSFPALQNMRGGGAGGLGGGFSLRATGFSPIPGMLGGPVQLDNTHVLTLSSIRQLNRMVYLRGVTHQVYDGHRWDGGGAEDRALAPNGDFVSDFGQGVFLSDMYLTVTTESPFGATLFSPLELRRIENLDMDYSVDNDLNLVADRALRAQHSYQVIARVPDYSAEQIRQLGTGTVTSEYEPYLQLPATLPRRVGQLAHDLTDSYTNPFDKAVAIESYLRGFDYELNMPTPPQDRDFVDYFLFSEQRGYCTYFATAMVVMLRELGIPARLVEGFAVPPGSTPIRTPDNWHYEVRNAHAHAWVEAYFPGYGWATFEPTPRADYPAIDRTRPLPTQTSAPEPVAPSEPSENTETPDAFSELEESPEDFNVGGGSQAGTTGPARQWPWPTTILLGLGALALLGYRRLQKLNRIHSAKGDQVVQEVWEKSNGLLDRFGFGREPHQTPREYAETLGKAWPTLHEAARTVAEDYTTTRYSPPDRPADPGVIQRAQQFWNSLLEALFTKFGWRTYLWRRLGWTRKRKG